MPTPTVELFDPIVLISIGIALVAFEALFFSFFLFWFGVASIMVGVISYVIDFSDGLWQICSIAVIAMVLLVVLRAKALDRFMRSKSREPNDDFLNTPGIGIIKEGKLYFKATYWNINSDDDFAQDEKVHVVSTKGATAVVQKIKETK